MWGLEARQTASDGAAGDQFGYAVALSGDGGTALVGASVDDVGGDEEQGSAYVFVPVLDAHPRRVNRCEKVS